MRRATTPTHKFTFPETVDVSGVTNVLITYSQCGKNILEKTLSDLGMNTEDNSFSLTLSQSEATLFAPGKALIQLRAKVGDTVFASQIISFSVKPVLDSEEM